MDSLQPGRFMRTPVDWSQHTAILLPTLIIMVMLKSHWMLCIGISHNVYTPSELFASDSSHANEHQVTESFISWWEILFAQFMSECVTH